MNIDLKFTVDYEGNPCIELVRPRKRESLEERLISAFVNKANKNGIRLIGAEFNISDTDGYDVYRIIANNKTTNKVK